MHATVICYGAGSAFHWVEEILEKRLKARIAGIIDERAASLKDRFSCPVWRPAEAAAMAAASETFRALPVIVALGNPQACRSVAQALAAQGFAEVLTLNAMYPVHLGFQLEDASPDLIGQALQAAGEDIRHARSLLADDASRQVFDQLLHMYRSRQGAWIASHPAAQAQFPPDLVADIDYSCVVRCGVDGAEIGDLLGQDQHRIRELICFEPDPVQLRGGGGFDGLLKHDFHRSAVNQASVLEIRPVAVHSSDGQARFHSAGMESHQGVAIAHRPTSFGSRLHPSGNCVVETVTLDASLRDRQPSFIIVDAEGNELAILEGARKVLARHRPALMIAVYHRVSQLWEVMLAILRSGVPYRFFMRNYTGFSYETFVYAIPDRTAVSAP